MSLTMHALDPIQFPLQGSSLIEASAGTGKTYTIVNLYLRLLLGRGCPARSVEQILVVTFTNAATAELKQRIRQRLRSAYLDFFRGQSQDAFLQQLIDDSEDAQQDCRRLALASQQMDEAAVFTIHSFSQKALSEHAFESGALYEQEFIVDESQWLRIAVEDFWRKHIVTLKQTKLQLVLGTWSEPEQLLRDIASYVYRDVAMATPLPAVDELIEQYQRTVEQAKAWWLNNEVEQQLLKAKLKGNVKLGKAVFLKQMTELCSSSRVVSYFDNLTWFDFTPDKIAKARKKESADLSHLDFVIFERLAEQLSRCQRAIKVVISAQAIAGVKVNLLGLKARLQLLSPDDLLNGLHSALTPELGTSDLLVDKLRETYPVALIDEFQDTDPIQFATFKRIYDTPEPENLCWIMIGDPKQAIYGFRGADIYTYIEAKNWVQDERHYTLATNWRSSSKLVNNVNQIFVQSAHGFMFEQSIPFYPVSAGRGNSEVCIAGKSTPSLHFQHLLSDGTLAMRASQARPLLAEHMAKQVAYWLDLSAHGLASVGERAIHGRDICVLVRDRNEAKLVKQALTRVQVDSVFLTRDSVFSTQIAQDVYRLLAALSQPNEERLLKTSLMTTLFGLTAVQLDELFNDDSQWQQILEHCLSWHQAWQTQGVMHALYLALQHFDIEQILLAQHDDGARRITDLRHLIELLQQQSMKMVGESQLLHWFESQLAAPEINNESQQLRIESDDDLVQIITLHASKGLEFPLVFIPFAAGYRAMEQALFHNQEDQLEVDFSQQDDNLLKADYERLAEDIRLFYVAVTRAVDYCYLGVWNSNLGKTVKTSGFCRSALGSLLLSEVTPSDAEVNGSISDEHIQRAIEQRFIGSDSDIECSYHSFQQVTDDAFPQLNLQPRVGNGESNPYESSNITHNQTRADDSPNLRVTEQSEHRVGASLRAQSLTRSVQRSWRLTSYSALSRQQQHLDMPLPGLDEGQDLAPALLFDGSNQVDMTPFSFEKGANAGSFLHGVLESVDFTQPEQLHQAIAEQGAKFGIQPDWYPMLQHWLTQVLSTEIKVAKDKQGLRLAQLAPAEVKVEMEFHMPLQQVAVDDFNQVINHFATQYARHYQFDTLNGMLKGFIDLTFTHDGQFYVADYKSNYLGDQRQDYDAVAMERCMLEHDYHLQGILYCLALHRWLQQRLPDYDYEQHVGGAFYLFLRGMNGDKPDAAVSDESRKDNNDNIGSGVYFFKPDATLIQALDLLFKGSKEVAEAIRKINQDADHGNAPSQPSQGQMSLW